MNEVANGIAGRDGVEIAVLPRGTGWDFVRTYKIPHRLAGAIDVALTGRPRAIDLGRVRYGSWAGGEAETWFANVASAGMSGAIAQRANETTKALGGKASYRAARRRAAAAAPQARRRGRSCRAGARLSGGGDGSRERSSAG